MKNFFLNWYTAYKLHILVWVLYISYEMASIAFAFNSSGSLIIYLSHYSVFIFFFYFHAQVTLRLALKNKRAAWWLAPTLVILQTVCFILIQFLVATVLYRLHIAKQLPVLNSAFVGRSAYRAFLFSGFSTGYYFLTNYLSARKRSEELEKDRLNAVILRERMEKELATAQNLFLKAQINPHLLFNTLDFIYHKVNAHSDQAGEAVIKLSEMMRFAIDSELMEGRIDLIEELRQVENLIYLHHLRSNQPLNVDFSYTQDAARLKFIPLILLTLAENIFKHGDLMQTEAQIAVYVEHEKLYLHTRNKINSRKAVPSKHTGLVNIHHRLVFAYTNEIEFEHHITADNEFVISIGVPVKHLS